MGLLGFFGKKCDLGHTEAQGQQEENNHRDGTFREEGYIGGLSRFQNVRRGSR